MARAVLRTKLTDLLGIRHPIVLGGLNYVESVQLSAAVANAGGLGLISAFLRPGDNLKSRIREAQSRLVTDGNRSCPGTLGVNLTLLPEMVQDMPRHFENAVATIVGEGIHVIETSGPMLEADLVDYVKKQHPNMKLIHKCTNMADAHNAVKWGVDAISLDGYECGGAPPDEEDVGNWVLQALGGRELSSSVPFITSGGVGTGRQMAAAMAMGASGVCMGTRFMATQEAVPDLKKNSPLQQALVERGFGRTAFQIQHPQEAGVSIRTEGVRLSIWSCGAVASLIDDVPTCQDLMEEIVAEAIGVIETLPAKVERR